MRRRLRGGGGGCGGGGRRRSAAQPGRGRARRWRHDLQRGGREVRLRRSSTDCRVRPVGGGGGGGEGGGGGSSGSGRRPLRGRRLGSSGPKSRPAQDDGGRGLRGARGPSADWLAALEIVTRPSLVVPLAMLSTIVVALSHGWLKLEPVDLGEIIKDLYGHHRE
ncbi:hypothetical protein ACP4OV_016625 [Aristida adscensionis]